MTVCPCSVLLQWGCLQPKGLTPDKYIINSAMDGRQYIYGAQLGLSYKINDWLSVFAGGRMNYFSGGYEGFWMPN